MRRPARIDRGVGDVHAYRRPTADERCTSEATTLRRPETMDQSMIDPIPPHLEVVIYGYFVLVAGIGCYLHVRLWNAWRRHRRGERSSPN